jgi:hypothetical protein
MAETCVEGVSRKIEVVDTADAEFHVVDLVLGDVAPHVYELFLGRVDADDAAGLLRQTERDRPRSAADVEDPGTVVEMRKQEVGVVRRVPDGQRPLEAPAQIRLRRR